MSTFPNSRLRIAGDLFRFTRLTDLLRPFEVNEYEEQTPLPPRFHAGDALQVEVAIFNDGVLLTDLSPFHRLTLTIKPLAPETLADTAAGQATNTAPHRGPAGNVKPLLIKSLGSGSFNTSLTPAQWDTKAADKAHAIITLDSGSSALTSGERWLALIAESADGQARTLAAGTVQILGGGATFNTPV